MELRYCHYPYPVLSPFNNDMENSSFDVVFDENSIISKIDRTIFKIKFELENETLLTMIENEEAYFLVHVECPSTMKKFGFKTYEEEFTFSIENNLLDRSIEINFLVLSNIKLDKYTNIDAHDDYKGIDFIINKAEILAHTLTKKIDIEKEYELKRADSIFELAPAEKSLAAPMSIDISDDLIKVIIPQEHYEKVNQLLNIDEATNSILIQYYYSSALMYSLCDIRNRFDDGSIIDLENLVWYQSIKYHLSQLDKEISDLNFEEIPEITHLLLKDSMKNSLLTLEKILEKED